MPCATIPSQAAAAHVCSDHGHPLSRAHFRSATDVTNVLTQSGSEPLAPAQQGLTPVRISAQAEPFLRQNSPQTPQTPPNTP